MSKHYSCTETAKLVRRALKEAFPGARFSVRSDTYSGGASIRIGWMDGPNERQVSAVAARFEGAYCDGTIDYKGILHKTFQGEAVTFLADFIFYHRGYSDTAIERAIGAVYREYVGNFEREGLAKPSPTAYLNGDLHGVHLGLPRDLQWYIGRNLQQHSDRLAVQPSPTAGAVVSLGNDGYSQNGAITAAQVQS